MPGRRRYLTTQVQRDLARRMAFVAGARQVGKTTFARAFPGAAAGYLNWDVATDRERILRARCRPDACGCSMNCTSFAAGETTSKACGTADPRASGFW